MYSSVIGKIEKAKRYAEEKGRVTFSSFVVTFRGENDDHKVEYSDGNLTCTCTFCHSMALQRMLEEMLPPVEVPQN